jgi:alkanesulfonate monooxygenase SsuD/methylene tetrahydromethanopterin reductase-like flavin-dependent oxidoreductase (luciferase family)
VLARQVATVDHLSGGRAILGVGLGVPPDAEYATFGESTDPVTRANLLDEGMRIIDGLWSGAPTSFTGTQLNVEEVTFLPPPIQQPRVPVWVAASLPARAGVRRAARWDGVAPIFSEGDDFRPVTPEEVAGMVDEIRARRGDLNGFDVVVFSIDLSPPAIAALEQAGATWIIGGPDPSRFLADAMEMAAEGPPAG